MTDTPQHVKDLQLSVWLSNTPAERLRKLMMDNDAIFDFFAAIKPMVKNSDLLHNDKKTSERI